MDQLGSYRLRKRLAVGGMGEVYLGEKIGPEGFVKPVVLKCVLPQLARDRAFVQLFLDEARLAALLNHPNIAQVYDFGLVEDVYYIAMEYVPGYTVDDIRRKLKSINAYMPLEHVACIASQVCQGLHYAHTLTDANGLGLGLVHRDVSPHNLIVSIDGSVKVVDFGIAKARAGLTRVQAKGAVGKFGYMSPEQSRGEVVDGRSDIFSLGVCLWELLTNERLHDPKLDRTPEYSPQNPIRSPAQIRRDLPRQFEQIVESALAIQPVDRYPNSQEMHLALERFQAALTHYAGQSALAKYIKDLVEGRIENPEGLASGEVVEPAGRASQKSPQDELEAPQKYQEVFGVTMDSDRARPRRAVPKSWAMTKPPSGPGDRHEERSLSPAPGPRGASPNGSDEGSGLELAATLPRARPQPARSSVPPRHRSEGRFPWILSAVLLAVASAGAYLYVDPILGRLRPVEAPRPKLMSAYRIASEPPGARVFLDEKPVEGATPLEVELIPDVEYDITVRMPKYATKSARVKASVGTEVRLIQFRLESAGWLEVRSDPPGASISVDGRALGGRVTPVTLDDVPAGQKVRVTAEIRGRPAQTKFVTIGRQKATLRFDFDAPPPR